MNIARCRINNNWLLIDIGEDILAGKIDERDITEIRCSDCGALAHLVHDPRRVLHFRANHEPYCCCVNDGREHRTHRINTDTVIDDVDDIITYTDHAPSARPTGHDRKKKPKHEEDKDKQTPIDDIDRVNIYGVRNIHTVGGMYNYIRANGLDANLGNDLTGRNLLLDAHALRTVRRDGMSGIKIAVAKRFNPAIVVYPINIPFGYTCLCDAFSTDIEDSVFFIVKLCHTEHNNLFRDKVMGNRKDKTAKDPHRNILLLGDWTIFPHNYYHIYKANINSRCYHFVNYVQPRNVN